MKADGRFAPLPIAASRTGLLGGCWSSSFSLSGRGNTLKRELQRGFPDIGLQGFAPKVLAHGHHGGNRYWEVELRPGDDPRYFQISVPVQPGNSGGTQPHGGTDLSRRSAAKTDGNSFPEFILGWTIGATEFNHG
jgi:hypothetical protein